MPRKRTLSRALALAAFISLASVSGAARAGEPNEGGNAAAESLFQEGRKLMEAKKYGDACPKFLASYKLSPAGGVLLNLADCYEKAGQLASAWARFHEAVAIAQRQGRADREKLARERADKLEPRLIKLTIIAQSKNIDVTLDDNALDPAVLGTAIPVDPGKHTLEARAKGKKPFKTSLDVSERTKSPSVEIPELEDVPEPVVEKPTKPKETTMPPEEEKGGGSTQKTLGIVGMAVGAAGVGVGAFFGLRTSSKWSEAQTHCTGIDCDSDGVTLATQAKNSGTISTIAFVAGGALLVGGAVLFFTAPSSTEKASSKSALKAARASTVRFGVGPGSVAVGGTF